MKKKKVIPREKCPIHKETKVFIYTKRSSKTANKKIDVGKQCETCLVGIVNSIPIPVKYLKGLEVGPMTKAEVRGSCPCGNLQSKNPRPSITCYDGACK